MRNIKLLPFYLTLCFYSFGQESKSLDLFFYLSDAALTETSKETIDSLLRSHGNQKIEVSSINAFCDPSGTSKFNQQLASDRSESVQNYLTQKGIAVKEKILTGQNYSHTNISKSDYQDLRKVVLTYKIIRKDPELRASTNPFDQISIEDIKSKNNDAIVLKIQFVPGQAILLDDSSFLNVYQFFDFMRNNENVHAFIRGHVCCADDYALSYNRANLVYQELTRRGISPKRLSLKGFSNTMPLAPENSDANRQLNRRVDVIFTIPEE